MLAEVRWRWRLNVLKTAAWAERNFPRRSRALEKVARIAREAADAIYKRECGIDIQHIRVLRIVAEKRTAQRPTRLCSLMLKAGSGLPLDRVHGTR